MKTLFLQIVKSDSKKKDKNKYKDLSVNIKKKTQLIKQKKIKIIVIKKIII